MMTKTQITAITKLRPNFNLDKIKIPKTLI